MKMPRSVVTDRDEFYNWVTLIAAAFRTDTIFISVRDYVYLDLRGCNHKIMGINGVFRVIPEAYLTPGEFDYVPGSVTVDKTCCLCGTDH